METTPTIRPARDGDCGRLSEIKHHYIHLMYSSVTPAQIMESTSLEKCAERIRALMQDDKLCVDVVEQNGEIRGFAAYGPDPDAEGWGLLYDTLYLIQTSIDLHHALLRHIVDSLAKAGMEHMHIWVLRNHYRARYLYELFGFRTDGMQLCHKAGEVEYRLIRYQYPSV